MEHQHDSGRLLRLRQIVGDAKAGLTPLVPIGRSTWLAGVKSGRFPAPVKLGPRTTAWRESDVRRLIADGVSKAALT